MELVLIHIPREDGTAILSLILLICPHEIKERPHKIYNHVLYVPSVVVLSSKCTATVVVWGIPISSDSTLIEKCTFTN
jgi:hypothetical protein